MVRQRAGVGRRRAGADEICVSEEQDARTGAMGGHPVGVAAANQTGCHLMSESDQHAVTVSFGTMLSALKIAGGVLVFLIGSRMLHGKHSEMAAVYRLPRRLAHGWDSFGRQSKREYGEAGNG